MNIHNWYTVIERLQFLKAHSKEISLNRISDETQVNPGKVLVCVNGYREVVRVFDEVLRCTDWMTCTRHRSIVLSNRSVIIIADVSLPENLLGQDPDYLVIV